MYEPRSSSKGMIETLSIIVGDLDNIDFRCAYVDGNNDVEMIIDDYLKESMGNETIVVTDILVEALIMSG